MKTRKEMLRGKGLTNYKGVRNKYTHTPCAHADQAKIEVAGNPNISTTRSCAGQATVEAAFVIPLVFFVLALLLQPLIILYDEMIMSSAAAEGCRLVSTRTDLGTGVYATQKIEYAIKHRLSSIPPISLFHLHESKCSYEVELSGDEYDNEVTVTIKNRVRLIPGISFFAQLAGLADKNGIYVISVAQTSPALPSGVSTKELFEFNWEVD